MSIGMAIAKRLKKVEFLNSFGTFFRPKNEKTAEIGIFTNKNIFAIHTFLSRCIVFQLQGVPIFQSNCYLAISSLIGSSYAKIWQKLTIGKNKDFNLKIFLIEESPAKLFLVAFNECLLYYGYLSRIKRKQLYQEIYDFNI